MTNATVADTVKGSAGRPRRFYHGEGKQIVGAEGTPVVTLAAATKLT
jgi:hypothetical protein